MGKNKDKQQKKDRSAQQPNQSGATMDTRNANQVNRKDV